MDWLRTRVVKIAGRIGVDPDEAVARFDKALETAQAVAKDVAEQAVPIAKTVAARLQSAAEAAAHDLADRIEKKRRPQPATLPPAVETTTPDSVTPGAKPHTVRAQSKGLDLAALSLSNDDARELSRIPTDLNTVSSEDSPSADTAQRMQAYVRGTTLAMFSTAQRVKTNVSAIADATGIPSNLVMDPWGAVCSTAHVLWKYDRANGTDFAASSWLAMLESWQPSQVKPDDTAAAHALTVAIRTVAQSPRAHVHAAALCDRLLAFAHLSGWPTMLFSDAKALDDLFAAAKSAADHPDQRDAVAKSLLNLSRAIMASSVGDAELTPHRMHPRALRAEIGLRAVAVLEALGQPNQDFAEAATAEAKRPEALPGPDELVELERLPRWFVEPGLSSISKARRFGSDELTAERAQELVHYVQATRGDLQQLSSRLEAFWRTPSTCAALAERFGVTAAPPSDMERNESFLSAAVDVTGNLHRATEMLSAYDAKHGTRYSVEAAQALLSSATGPDARKLVRVARGAIASPSASADDKRLFVARIPELADRGAWPGVHGGDEAAAMRAILGGLTDLAKADENVASNAFFAMVSVVNTEVVDQRGSPDAASEDKAGRAAAAAFTAEFATAIGRDNDAAYFRALDEKLVAAISAA